MTPNDAPEFYRRLAGLCEYFDVKPFSESKSTLYFDALQDLPLDAVIRAMNEAVKRCKFTPKVAELRELIEGDTETRIESAWLEWKRTAREQGAYSSPEFTDGALGRTVRAVFGTWEVACAFDASPEMWAAKRKEFGRVYRSFAARGQTGPVALIGFFERDRLERGDVPERRISDSEIAGLLGDGSDTKH